MTRTCKLIVLCACLAVCASAQQFEPQMRIALRTIHAEEFTGANVPLFILPPGAAMVRAAIVVDSAWVASSSVSVGVDDCTDCILACDTIANLPVGSSWGLSPYESGSFFDRGGLTRYSAPTAVSAAIDGWAGNACGSLKFYLWIVEMP
jgi:hypothetical protein